MGLDGLDGRYGQNGQNDSGKAALYPEVAANAALVLIGVASVLLDRQITRLANDFENKGGFTERLYKTRQAARNK